MSDENMKNLFSKSMKKRKWAILTVSIIAFTAVFGYLLFEGTKKSVALTLNGKEQEVRTHANTIQDILQDLKIPLQSEDYLYPTGATEVTNNMKVVWEPAKQVEIKVGKETKKVWTTAGTVKELLSDEKIEIGEHDKINISLDEEVTEETKVEIAPAFPVKLVDGGSEKAAWSTSTTVADFLKQQGITLTDEDRVEPNLDTAVKANDVINVVRVEKVTDVVEEPKEFAVVTRQDSDLTKGKEEVVQAGQQGLIEKKYEVVKENGKEVSRKLVSEKTVKESQDKIVSVGTKVLVAQVSRGSSSSSAQTTSASAPSSGGKEFYVSSTAYTGSCNGCSGITATGINLRANPGVKVIAVDPSIIPLGTKVYVDGYGYAVAADTGGAIKGNKIDVFFPSKSEAYRWGRKQVKIKILN